jgi:hypothetical protein
MPLLALLSDVFGASHVRALARAHGDDAGCGDYRDW